MDRSLSLKVPEQDRQRMQKAKEDIPDILFHIFSSTKYQRRRFCLQWDCPDQHLHVEMSNASHHSAKHPDNRSSSSRIENIE